MGPGAFRGYGLRTVALALIVLALSLRVFIPNGFMVAPDGGGLVICTGLGGTASLDNSEKAPVEKGVQHCPFTAALAAAPPPEPTAVSAPVVFAVAIALTPAADQRPGLGLAAPPPLSTGPPSSLT